MGIRPEDIYVEEEGDVAVLDAKVTLAEMMGSEIYLYFTYEGQNLIARIPSDVEVQADDTIRLALDEEKVHVFDKETEKIICQ